MAETIVVEGKMKCRGTIKKGGLSGKECRRTILVKDPELGWGVPCDRCQEFHPLRKVLRDLVGSGELDGKERKDLAAVSKQEENKEEKMAKGPEFSRDPEEHKKSIMAALQFLKFHGSIFHGNKLQGIKKVVYYFSTDGSDYEVDEPSIDKSGIAKPKGPILSTYYPNQKISYRLENELPTEIQFVFTKGAILRLR